MGNVKHWYWAALVVSSAVHLHLPQVQDVPKILAVFVSENLIYVGATGELIEIDVELTFERE